MDTDRPTDFPPSRADRFGGPTLTGHAEFTSSGILVRKCVLASSAGRIATVRGSDVRLFDGTRLRFETSWAGIRSRRGRTALLDLPGNTLASAEWVASDHYFQIHSDGAGYAAERVGRHHRWQLYADGHVADFDRRTVEAGVAVPVLAVLLAWRVARTLEHTLGPATQRTAGWKRSADSFGS